MGLFGEVKCGRCDRRYSAIRSRCPYCGARKKRSGKTQGYDDNKRQIIFGVILLVVIVAAVSLLVYKNLSAGKAGTSPSPTAQVTSTPKSSSTPTPTSSAPATSTSPSSGTKVTSIVLSRQDFTLTSIGETWVLSATLTPSNATQTITWTSQDTKVATVDSNGRVTAVSAGSTTIVADAGGVQATCIVRVTGTGTASTPASTTSTSGSVSLSNSDVTLNATTNETFQLKVNGASSTPTFSSANTSIATVDSNGTVKAVSAGTTSVYATVGGTKLECVVRVVKK